MGRRMVSTTCYLDAAQVDLLRLLSDTTKVPVAEYVRQGIDHVLDDPTAEVTRVAVNLARTRIMLVQRRDEMVKEIDEEIAAIEAELARAAAAAAEAEPPPYDKAKWAEAAGTWPAPTVVISKPEGPPWTQKS